VRPFMSHADSRTGVRVPIQIATLTYNDALFWQHEIQPDIRRLPDRLDNNWNWPQLMLWLSPIEFLRRRELVGYVVLVSNRLGMAVPAGLVLLSAGYPTLDAPNLPSVFVWYLATAPTAVLSRFDVPDKPLLLEVLVDVGMVESEARGYGGRIGLHAANRGNSPVSQALYSAYQARCGLMPLPATLNLPGIRRNDGRYFVASEVVAGNRMIALDSWR
jgi:hypothetical protein